MRYHLLLVTEVPGVPSVYRNIASVENEVPSSALEEILVNRVFTAAGEAIHDAFPDQTGMPENFRRGAHTGRKGKAILIREVAEEVVSSSSFHRGEVVLSSTEASLRLGYNYNMVSQALSIAAKKQRDLAAAEKDVVERKLIENTITEATLRGVTFCYQDEIFKDVSI